MLIESHASQCVWRIFQSARKRFWQIDGGERAAAFSYYAFFSLFPLVVLLVTIASLTLDPASAAQEVISYVEGYVPLNADMRSRVFDTIKGVLENGGQAGVWSLVMLVWVALQGITTLITTTNRAWGTVMHNWWRLPLKSLLLLGIVAASVLAGVAVPVVAGALPQWLFPVYELRTWVDELIHFLVPWLLLFISLTLFYRFAPRRPTRIIEVWPAALITTTFLRLSESLFVIYLREFATFNAVYGAFGTIIALMLWLYVSGCIFIFGACLCAAQAEVAEKDAQNARGRDVPHREKVAEGRS